MSDEDQARLMALHSLLQQRIGKRISYSVVVRHALERLAVIEGVKLHNA